MNTTELISKPIQLLDILKWSTPFIFFFCAFVFIRLRTGSAGFILHRLWALLGGKKDFLNPKLQKEASKLDDFEKIKYMTGIRFHNFASVTTTLAWLKRHEIGLEELIRVRSYFDPKKNSLRSPKLKWRRFFSKITVSFFFASALLIFVASYGPAWLSVKKTGTNLWVSQDATQIKSSKGWTLTSKDCLTKNIELEKDDSPSAFDQKVACDLLTSEEKEKTIKSVISEQTGVAGLVFFIFVAIMVATARSVATAEAAADIYRRTNTTDSYE
ncbi:DUF6216 family protein [Metapseudomonas otitidis]|uniref:DUF6216 family protein n=1 Tax=Metapseudomonas otitidis TaxID=319939 RepID=UPI003CEFFB21